MVNYFAKFNPLMSLITGPIRKVMKSDVELKWDKEKEEVTNKRNPYRSSSTSRTTTLIDQYQ